MKIWEKEVEDCNKKENFERKCKDGILAHMGTMLKYHAPEDGNFFKLCRNLKKR
jgi:hypothetical protein